MRPTLRQERLRLTWLLALPFLFFSRPTPALLCAGALLALPGLALRGVGANHIHKDRALAVTGPFAHVRHPLYLGSFLVGVGFAVAGGKVLFLPAFLLLFACVYGRAMKAEDAHLEELFGGAFLRYREGVPALVPRWRRFEARDGEPPARGVAALGEEGSGAASGQAPDGSPAPSPGGAGPSSDPALPPTGPLRLYRRNKEWQAVVGALAGFGLLWLRMKIR